MTRRPRSSRRIWAGFEVPLKSRAVFVHLRCHTCGTRLATISHVDGDERPAISLGNGLVFENLDASGAATKWSIRCPNDPTDIQLTERHAMRLLLEVPIDGSTPQRVSRTVSV